MDNGLLTSSPTPAYESTHGRCVCSSLPIILMAIGWLCPSPAAAQWVKTSFPGDTTVRAIAARGSYIFAGSEQAGVFRSSNNGASWTRQNTGIPISASVYALLVNGTDLYAGTSLGVYRTTNDGAAWIAVNNGLPNVAVTAMTLGWNGNIWIGNTASGIYRTSNNGQSWTQVPLPSPVTGYPSYAVSAMAFNGNFLFVGGRDWHDMDDALIRYSNGGVSGSVIFDVNTRPWGGIHCMLTEGSTIYLAGGDRLRYSLANGDSGSWQFWSDEGCCALFCLQRQGYRMFGGSNYGGALATDDFTRYWNQTGFPTWNSVQSLRIVDTVIYAGTWQNGLWKRSLSQLTPVRLESFTAEELGGKIHLRWLTASETNVGGFEIQRSIDAGDNWTAIAFVRATGIAGGKNEYRFVDDRRIPGESGAMIFYRLKIVNADDSFEYSPVAEARRDGWSIVPVTLDVRWNGNTAEIAYSLGQHSNVTLRVYDVLGRVAAEPLRAQQSEGRHVLSYDASGLSRGVWIFSLETGTDQAARMIMK
jgi:hypothetical protein